MRLHRFYIDQSIGDQVEISVDSEELRHQIINVFRLKEGDSVILFDGSGFDYECRISTFSDQRKDDKNLVTFTVTRKTNSRYMPSREVILCAAVVKKDTFEWIVEKATELGVSKTIPIIAERSEKKALNEERLKKIAVEASEQSGRGTVPVVESITELPNALDEISSSLKDTKIQAIAFHTEGGPLKIQQDPAVLPLYVFIGPEGGWSLDEIKLFHANQVPISCLGSQVLRTETAVVSALSLILLGK